MMQNVTTEFVAYDVNHEEIILTDSQVHWIKALFRDLSFKHQRTNSSEAYWMIDDFLNCDLSWDILDAKLQIVPVRDLKDAIHCLKGADVSETNELAKIVESNTRIIKPRHIVKHPVVDVDAHRGPDDLPF